MQEGVEKNDHPRDHEGTGGISHDPGTLEPIELALQFAASAIGVDLVGVVPLSPSY